MNSLYKYHIKRTILSLALLLFAFQANAAIKVTAHAPEVVAEGEQFRLQYTINTQQITGVSQINEINGFDILYGPSTSSSYSMQIINGKQTQNSSLTYTYTLRANKKGTFTMPRITFTAEGKNYSSNQIQVKVVENANADKGAGNSSHGNPAAVRENTSAKLTGKDLFITVTSNKKEVYEQEPILLTYRVYTRVNLTELQGKMPDLKGFQVKEIPLPQQKSFSVQEYNGENYYCTVWSQYVMFPQQPGSLKVPAITFDGVVSINNPDVRHMDIIDAFFNGTSPTIRKKVSVTAPPLNIQVKSLPQGPADYSGGVGKFSIQAVAKNPHLKEYETLNLRVTITGTGNLDLIKAPKLQLPGDFDTYDPKMTNNTKLSATSQNGSLIIDYPAVPKAKGSYTIPPVKLTYFDTESHTYRTIESQPISIVVDKGDKSNYSQQREILEKQDIRFIHTGEIDLDSNHRNSFWGTIFYWILYPMLFLLTIVLLYLQNKRSALHSNATRMRLRGASKLASKRLKRARALASAQKDNEFYEEMISALSGFVGDKCSIPTSELSKERMQDSLAAHQVDSETISDFCNILDECQMLRYVGGSDKTTRMNEIYQSGLQIIQTLDSQIR